MPDSPSDARQVAESFGVDAERYDRTRPSYPAEIVERVLSRCPGRMVLAVGSGTGIDARQFQDAGATVLGVEPDPRMAAVARARGVQTEEATFEDWEPAGRTFDAVVAGTSWHWVDPAIGARKAAGVLHAGGVLALYGHAFEAPAPTARAYDEAFREVAPGSGLVRRTDRPLAEAYEALYASFAAVVRDTGAFDEPIPWRLDWDRTYTRDGWLDLLRTTGGLTSLRPDQVDQVLDRVARTIDDAGFTTTHTTVMITARK